MMKNKDSYVGTMLLITMVLISIACGRSVSPTLVSTVAPQPTTAPTIKEAETQPVEEKPVEPTNTIPADTPTPVPPMNYKIGEIASMGDWALDVLGWEILPGDQFNKPDEGKKFIVVEVLIVNLSQSGEIFSTISSLYLKDDSGQKYNIDYKAVVAAHAATIDGELSPGERIRGKIGFQILENAKGLQLVFDADFEGSGKAFIELGEEPISVEPPASIPGEKEQPAHNLGESVEIGSISLIVNEVKFPEVDSFYKPYDGYKFMLVDVTVENKGTSSYRLLSIAQMWVKDPTGQKYAEDMMATTVSGGTMPDGELVAGEKIRGQVGFQVPENSTGLVFVFDPDMVNFGKIFVALP